MSIEVATNTEVKKPSRKPRPSEIAAKKAKAAKKKTKPAKKAKAAKKAVNGTGKKKIGRPFLYPDMTLVRMPKGTLARIHKACKADEGQADFMRGAVMKELSARRG